MENMKYMKKLKHKVKGDTEWGSRSFTNEKGARRSMQQGVRQGAGKYKRKIVTYSTNSLSLLTANMQSERLKDTLSFRELIIKQGAD